MSGASIVGAKCLLPNTCRGLFFLQRIWSLYPKRFLMVFLSSERSLSWPCICPSVNPSFKVISFLGMMWVDVKPTLSLYSTRMDVKYWGCQAQLKLLGSLPNLFFTSKALHRLPGPFNFGADGLRREETREEVWRCVKIQYVKAEQSTSFVQQKFRKHSERFVATLLQLFPSVPRFSISVSLSTSGSSCGELSAILKKRCSTYCLPYFISHIA